jgi:PAS domain S-box-containing protein/diguanylate cyclase (GGDEF)-like protein
MNLNLKSKLLLLSIIPLLFVIFLSSVVLFELYSDKKNLSLTKDRILEAEAISKIIHSLQIERGLTAGLIASENLNEKDQDLIDAKKSSDRAIEDAKIVFSKITKNNNEGILNLLKDLKSRANEHLISLPAKDAKNYYTKNISYLIDFTKTIPAMMNDNENRNYIQAYTYLTSSKEYMGRTRAAFMDVFTTNKFLDDTFTSVKEYLKLYENDIENFKITVPKDILNFYGNNFKGEAVDETYKMIKTALAKKSSDNFNTLPSYWFERSSQTINLLKGVENELFNKVNSLINKKLSVVFYKIGSLLFFLIASCIVVTTMVIYTIRQILFSANTLEDKYSLSDKLLGQYKQTVDRSFIVSKTNPKGIITYVNDEFCKISGYSKEELIGKPHNIIRHPDTPKEFFKDMWHTIKHLKQPWIGEVKNKNKSGTSYWMKAIINPILDSDGNVVEYIGIRTDITQQKQITQYFEDQLKLSNKNFDYSIHLSKEYEKAMDTSTILSRTDKNGIITYANDKFLEISGYTLKDLIGKTHNIVSSLDTSSKTYNDIWQTIKNAKVWQGIIKNQTKHGKEFWTKTTIIPIKDLDGNIVEYLAVRHDITEIIEQRKEFEKKAITDPLTGCGNRFRLSQDMQKLENLSAAIFNIDNFRQINDFYGQKFGDLIIKSIANKIYAQLEEDENFKFYRLQGDEFIAIATNYSKEALIEKVKKILQIIKEKFVVENEEILISCSCGISFEDKEHLLSSANMALKIAKKSNADYLVYDETKSLNKMYEDNIHWAKKVSDAIKKENIITYYQPIVNNSTMVYEKHECLVRMRDNDKIISPFFFLEVAKQTRQYFDITKAVIYQSFEMFKDKDLEFSINLSVKDIIEVQMSDYILDMLERYGIGSKVVFEIVESESIENFEGVIHFINKVKKYGSKIAIDDFGTGYSNFEYLIKLRADFLKIDGSLIKNLDHDRNAYVVVSTIVEFSKKLGMKTIAEFVENEEIFNIVKDLGIDYSQGYYFSPPKEKLENY